MDGECRSSDEESPAAAAAPASARTTSASPPPNSAEEPSYRRVRRHHRGGRYEANIMDPERKQRKWHGMYDPAIKAAPAYDVPSLGVYGNLATEMAPEGSARLPGRNIASFLSIERLARPKNIEKESLPGIWPSYMRSETVPTPPYFSDTELKLSPAVGSQYCRPPVNSIHELTAPAPSLIFKGCPQADAGMTVAPRMPDGAALSAASTQTGVTDEPTHHLQLQPADEEEKHHHPPLCVGSHCASLGAMGSLLSKLQALLAPGCTQLPEKVKHGMQFLKDDLQEVIAYLEDLSEVEDPPLTAKCWMKEVRELSYDIEDYIDRFVVPPVRAKFNTRFLSKTRCVKITRPPKRFKRHQKILEMISNFRIYVREAIERHENYELDRCAFRRRFVSVGPMLQTTPYEETADLVIDGRMSDFITYLANDGDQQLKVVSVFGPGCLGKTTLAKVFYNKFGRRYDCTAFVWVSQKPDMKRIFRDILWQIQRQQPPDDCKELDLVDNIRKHLQDRRYLLIIDDLWAASVWDIIIRAFPKGSQRSRIITTTQIEDVALSCCCYSSDYVFEMRPLDDYHSRKLFFGRLLGSDTYCPQQFEEVLSEIVGICGGLPLATISIASLLASQPSILMDLLMYIRDSLSSCLLANSTSEGMRQVLNLSYNNLPRYLKTCLLYLIIYPECRTIWKDDLVNQWIAEGFINTAEGQDMEKVAESYFDELIDRRFIQPMSVNYNNEVLSCTVHGMVRDLIAHKSAEENFILVTDYYRKNMTLSDNVHRLSLHFGYAKYAKIPANIRKSQVRSLTFFGLSKCMPSITQFKLVRVLNLELSGHHGDVTLDLTKISELFQLRYLKVASAHDVCVELPNHMRALQCLETMDVNAKFTAVPWDIIDLPRMLHLRLRVETSLFDWISTMRSDSLWSLGKLKDLRCFHLSCSTPPSDHLQRSMEALGSLFQGHGSLKTLSMVPGSFDKIVVARDSSEVIIVSWDGLVPPRLLERFEWLLRNCIFSGVPKWMGELSKLCILKIAVKVLLTHDIDVLGGLPALTGLSLYVQTVPANKIVFGKSGFSVLRYFKFRCSVPWLKFEANAMPNLQKLKLGFDAPTVNQEHGITPIVIEHLSGLEDISAKIGGAGVDAESALDISVCNDPRNPEVQLVGSVFMMTKKEVR